MKKKKFNLTYVLIALIFFIVGMLVSNTLSIIYIDKLENSFDLNIKVSQESTIFNYTEEPLDFPIDYDGRYSNISNSTIP